MTQFHLDMGRTSTLADSLLVEWSLIVKQKSEGICSLDLQHRLL